MILTILVVTQLQQPKLQGVELKPVPITRQVNPQRTASPQYAPQVHGPIRLTNELNYSDFLKGLDEGAIRLDDTDAE